MSRARRFPRLLPLPALAGLPAPLAWPALAQSDPTRPSNLTAEIVDNGVSLTWDAPTTDAGTVSGFKENRTDA